METESNSKYSDFEILLKQYIEKLDKVIEKLDGLLDTIESHHHYCNIAKTAATTVSSTGVVIVIGSVLFSPFTAGSTLAMGAGGAVMSLTGSLSNVITDYVDYKTSSMIMSDIETILKSREDFDENLKKQLNNFEMVIEKLTESGVDKDSAILVAVKGIATGCIDLTNEPNMRLMNTLSTVVKLHHIEGAALETLPIIGKTMHISEKSYQFIYNFFGLTGHTGAAVFKTIGRISSVVSVAFTLVDIAFLIKDWSSEHPTIELVMEAKRKLKEEKEILGIFLEVFDASRGNTESVLHKVIKEIEYIEDNKSDLNIDENNESDFDENIENDFVIVSKEEESF
ncbi:hypothetical protein NQ318_000534 [Aromia moschata]|uniref:Apolipoprotein L3 n=1 Tax=Aromia moschata TaxID=1265417 RepID=A0AAV8YDQ6_9CUCU|nr:hypothetical protein NQ318_000534 [Aromia moschata]